MKYYIGIDGGGTKTAICTVRADDFATFSTITIGSSWREHGAEGVAKLLKKSILEQHGEGQIAGMAMGLPCYGESIEGDRDLEEAVRREFPGIPIYFANDVEVGWAGSLALRPGINIVAGTGAIAFGKDADGKTARSGGWSEFFGDEGSCYWIGRRVIEMFSKQADGRLPKDALYRVICEEFALINDRDIIDIIHNQYLPSRKQVANLQILANKAALAGSGCAVALYDQAVDELCLLVDSVKNQLHFGEEPFTVSYTGGLYTQAGEFILPRFSREIERKGGRIAAPCLNPEEGAALLAFQHFYPESFERALEVMLARDKQNPPRVPDEEAV